jgi:glycosyltransferase involved in cell wall biosynthesis
MRVLFVSSGNSTGGLSPIVKNQGDSLVKQGIQLDFYTLKGKGLWSYLRNIFILHKYLKENQYTLIHGHYLFSGVIAAFAGARPLVISLMGSDIMHFKLMIPVVRLITRLYKLKIIVKTEEMFNLLKIKNVSIIPNGVDIQKFRPYSKYEVQKLLGWDTGKRHVLFPASEERDEKNYQLLLKAIEMIDDDNIVLHTMANIANDKVPDYYNASDIVVLTSLREGSPNVIKEAMACNVPIVSVDVGDVKKNIMNINGCFICSFDPHDVVEKIIEALDFSRNEKRTNSRERLIELGLDSTSTANRIKKVYEEALSLSSQS